MREPERHGEPGDVVQQPARLRLLDVETGQGPQFAAVVPGLHDAWLHPQPGPVGVGDDVHLLDVEAELVEGLHEPLNAPHLVDAELLGPGQLVPEHGVALLEVRIGLGVPAFVVDPVHDSDQVLPPVAQEPLEPRSGLRALDDLARVGGGDGGQLLGEHQARLHQIELAVELERVCVEEVAGQPQVDHRLAGKDPLVRHVVDGEDAARAEGRRPARPAALHDQRH